MAKSKPTAMTLVSYVPTSSSSVNNPIESRRLGGHSKLQVDRLDYQGDLVQAQIKNPIPTQRRVLKYGKGMLNCSKAQGNLWQLCTNDIQKKTETPEDSEDSELESRIWPHPFRRSPDIVDNMEKVFSIIRKTYDRKPTDDLVDLDVATAIWGIFMSVTLQAPVHLGQEYSKNLRSIKNQPLKSVKQLFRTTEMLIKDQLRSQVCPRLIRTSLCGENHVTV